MTPSSFGELKDSSLVEKSASIRERVLEARKVQQNRYKKYDFDYNDALPSKLIDKYCQLSKDASDFMEMIFQRNKLSIRSYHKLLRVSRTIADLDNKDRIELEHISEALNFRKPLQKYWG